MEPEPLNTKSAVKVSQLKDSSVGLGPISQSFTPHSTAASLSAQYIRSRSSFIRNIYSGPISTDLNPYRTAFSNTGSDGFSHNVQFLFCSIHMLISGPISMSKFHKSRANIRRISAYARLKNSSEKCRCRR